MSEVACLTRVTRFDSVPLNATYFTEEGYLMDHPIVTTCGIFEYTNKDGSTRKELRLPEEVFARKSLESYKGKPVIITHNAGVVNKDNVADEIIGTILSNGYKDGKDVRVEIIVHETEKLKTSGLRALSLGYNLELDETPGEWHGEHYDAIQRNIEINHLALVAEARAGENARLNIDSRDKKNGGEKMKKKHRRSDGEPMDPVVLEEAINAFKARKEQSEKEEAAEQEKKDAAKKRFGFFRRKKDGNNLALNNAVPGDDEEVEKKAVFAETEKEPETVESRIDSVLRRRAKRDEVDEPRDSRHAMELIAEQDEDIDELLKIIEEMSAKQNKDADDFEDADPENDEYEQDEDEEDFSEFEGEDEEFEEDEDEEEIDNEPAPEEEEEEFEEEDEEFDEDEDDEEEMEGFEEIEADEPDDEDDDEEEFDEDEDDEFPDEDEDEDVEVEAVGFKKDKKHCDKKHCDNAKSRAGRINLDSANRYAREKIDVCRTGDLLNMNVDNMKIADAKKAIIKKMNPGVRLDGKSASYVNAMYDTAKAQAKKRRSTDYQRRQMFNKDGFGSATKKTGADKAREKMIKKMGEIR